MKILARLNRVFKPSSASDRPISRVHGQKRELQLKVNDLGTCAVYEKELQRLCPITEENRRVKIAEFAKKQGFRLAYYKQGHCAIFVEEAPPRVQTCFVTRNFAHQDSCVAFSKAGDPWRL